MTDKNGDTNKSHTGLIAGIAAAVAAGAVYFYGPDGKERREKLQGWVLKTKGEVLEKLEDAEEVTKEKYEEIVDAAVTKFTAEKEKRESQAETLREELKGHWEAIKHRVEEKGEDLREAAADEVSKQGEKASEKIAPDEK